MTTTNERLASKRAPKETRIRQHGLNLLAIFPNSVERDPSTLCKKLRRLEAKAAALALRGCNGPKWGSEEEQEAAYDAILGKVRDLLRPSDTIPIFINLDPRGYQLKIRDYWMTANQEHWLDRDLGGYGILAPEIK